MTDLRLPDGLPASEIIERIIIAKGVPVLCWSPGKWTFRRAKVVESMLNRFKPGELFLGDTTLRPSFALTPGTFRKFKEHRILAGSDPLPLSGEERMLGRYFSLLESPFDTERPGESVRAALHRQGEHLGSRCSWAEVISRLGRLYCLRSIKRLT
ncbi:MAG: hypothetical protein DCC75_14230 [Proteobacteria bacterium]|nr:MAG: hypothetical protein DCC75_14230 [Pseudomonadota bacterium]